MQAAITSAVSDLIAERGIDTAVEVLAEYLLDGALAALNTEDTDTRTEFLSNLALAVTLEQQAEAYR